MKEKAFCGMAYATATELSRGKAASYLKKVHDMDMDLVIVKNSEPYAVLMSVEKYEKMQGEIDRLKSYINNISEKDRL